MGTSQYDIPEPSTNYMASRPIRKYGCNSESKSKWGELFSTVVFNTAMVSISLYYLTKFFFLINDGSDIEVLYVNVMRTIP